MPDPKTRLRPMLAPDDELVFDTVESIRFAHPAEITRLPVEVGALMTDHIQVQGRPIFIQGIVSATPFGEESTGDPRELAVAWFERNRTAMLEVVTPAGLFRDLLLVDYPYVYQGTRHYSFGVHLEHVRLVSPVSVPIPPRVPVPRAAPGHSSEQDSGDTANKPVDSPPSGSFLAAIARGFGFGAIREAP